MVTEKQVSSGTRNVVVGEVSATQASVNGLTVLAGSEIDAAPWYSLSLSFMPATHDVKWQVFAGNKSDYSDEQSVQNLASVVAAAVGYYSVSLPPWRYYRVKIQSTVADTPGATVLAGFLRSNR